MSRFALSCAFLCGSAWALFGSCAARAQDVEFLAPPFKSEDQEKFKEALNREPPPSDAELKMAATATQYLVFRLTDKGKYHDKVGAMQSLVADADRWIRQVFTQADVKNVPLQQAFRVRMIEALDKVLSPPDQRPIARVNAARVLSRLASLSGQEETADLLVKVIEDPGELDGARYWALRGLKDLLARASQKPPVVVKDAKRRAKIVEALVQFIERPSPLEKAPPQEEIDGQCVIRREAIRALAQVRAPFVAGNAKANAALALLRIVSKDKNLKIPPRVDEQVEAAIGLALMQPDNGREYQPAFAAYQIGTFLAGDFRRAYRQYKATDVAHLAWKVEAARLGDALKVMLATSPNDATVKQIAQLGGALVRNVERGVEPGDNALANWLEMTAAPPAPFKSEPKTVVPPGEKK